MTIVANWMSIVVILSKYSYPSAHQQHLWFSNIYFSSFRHYRNENSKKSIWVTRNMGLYHDLYELYRFDHFWMVSWFVTILWDRENIRDIAHIQCLWIIVIIYNYGLEPADSNQRPLALQARISRLRHKNVTLQWLFLIYQFENVVYLDI